MHYNVFVPHLLRLLARQVAVLHKPGQVSLQRGQQVQVEELP